MGKQKFKQHSNQRPPSAATNPKPQLAQHAAPILFAIMAALAAAAWHQFHSTSGSPSAPSLHADKVVNKVAKAALDTAIVQDNHTGCVAWAAGGECENNPSFMLEQCAAACKARAAGAAGAVRAGADEVLPDGWKEYKDPSTGKTYYSDGATSQWERPTARASAKKAAASSRSGTGAAAVSGTYTDTWERPHECTAWAGDGQCEANPGFMLVSCEASCHKLGVTRQAYAERCKRAEGARPALAPGAMMQTFDRIMAEFGHLEPEMISSDPPIVLFHNFLSGEEADALVSHGKGKYAESKGVGVDANGRMTDVKTEIRTSSHTWCQESACLNDPTVQGVIARVHDVTLTPATNAEFAQLVYYHACPADGDPSCAFYRRHSDYIAGDAHRNQGVRIYTLFMYLNDVWR